MRSIATDGVAWSVCLSVCNGDEPRKTAEPTEMLFGMWAPVGPSNHVLDRGLDPQGKGQFLGWAYMGMPRHP